MHVRRLLGLTFGALPRVFVATACAAAAGCSAKLDKFSTE